MVSNLRGYVTTLQVGYLSETAALYTVHVVNSLWVINSSVWLAFGRLLFSRLGKRGVLPLYIKTLLVAFTRFVIIRYNCFNMFLSLDRPIFVQYFTLVFTVLSNLNHFLFSRSRTVINILFTSFSRCKI